MLNRNPNLVECPIHHLHYDQTKQDGCALCIRAEMDIAKRKAARQQTPSLVMPILIAVVCGVLVWAIMYFIFPPKADLDHSDEIVNFNYEAPIGWIAEDRSGKDVALDKMGLRLTENYAWSIPDRFVYKSGNPADNFFLEYIQVLKGPGALVVNEEAIELIKDKIKEVRPTAYLMPIVQDIQLTNFGSTPAVQATVTYQSEKEHYDAWVYYIPAGGHHYWITLAAQRHEWDRFAPSFERFVASISGGHQGYGEPSKLPGFLLSPHRAILAGIGSCLFFLWLATFIQFRKPKKKAKPKITAKQAAALAAKKKEAAAKKNNK